MNDKLISVVIPCYNVAEWVKKCLNSVLTQTYTNLEVIAVDDGSTDNTAEILKSYTDYRLRIVTQRNKGVSAARNNGIDYATGDYIAFVDSDDWLEPDMYSRLYQAIVNENANVSVCNYNLAYDDRIERQYSKLFNGATNIQDDTYIYFMKYCACAKPNNYIWTRLYDADLVKNSGVTFENYKLGDDVLFNFKLLPYIKRIAWIPEGYYNYYQRTSSNIFTVATKSNLAEVYADTFDSLAEHYESNGFSEFSQVLPIHAYTRLRSVFFYSRLAGMSDGAIYASIIAGFKGRKIVQYLTGAMS